MKILKWFGRALTKNLLPERWIWNINIVDIISLVFNLYTLTTSSYFTGIFFLSLTLLFKVLIYRQQLIIKDRLHLIDSQFELIVLEYTVLEFRLLGKECCRDCKYYHGKNSILCAVHPKGLETEDCKDKEKMECP